MCHYHSERERNGPEPHAAGRCQSCDKRCECGYYHLHRNLNDAFLIHVFQGIRLVNCSLSGVITTLGTTLLLG